MDLTAIIVTGVVGLAGIVSTYLSAKRGSDAARAAADRQHRRDTYMAFMRAARRVRADTNRENVARYDDALSDLQFVASHEVAQAALAVQASLHGRIGMPVDSGEAPTRPTWSQATIAFSVAARVDLGLPFSESLAADVAAAKIRADGA